MTLQIIFFDTSGGLLGEWRNGMTTDTVPLVGDKVKFLADKELWTGTVTSRLFEYFDTVGDRLAFVNLFLTLINVHAGG